MNDFNNKAWSLIDESLPIMIDNVKMWLKPLTNGQKIILAGQMQDTSNFDETMTLLAKSVEKLEIDGRIIDDDTKIIEMFVRLDSFKTQNKILEAVITITDLKDVERKNSPSSSAT